MRIEGDLKSSLHWSLFFKDGRSIRILLDGREVKHCRMADDEAGEVEIELHDEHGNLVLDPEKNEIATQKLTGRVEIIGGRWEHPQWPM